MIFSQSRVELSTFHLDESFKRENSQLSFLNYNSVRTDTDQHAWGGPDWIKPIDYKLIKPGWHSWHSWCHLEWWGARYQYCTVTQIIIIVITSHSDFLIQNIEIYQEVAKKSRICRCTFLKSHWDFLDGPGERGNNQQETEVNDA